MFSSAYTAEQSLRNIFEKIHDFYTARKCLKNLKKYIKNPDFWSKYLYILEVVKIFKKIYGKKTGMPSIFSKFIQMESL